MNQPSTLPPSAPSRQVRLTQLQPGQTAVIASTTLDVSDAALLKAMGLCDRARVRVCRVGEPCVVAVGGVSSENCGCAGSCRIGLARPLAERIFVIPGV